jgi:hypothetical protein
MVRSGDGVDALALPFLSDTIAGRVTMSAPACFIFRLTPVQSLHIY